MTVMDFSGIYEREPWMRERKERWISFRGLPGTDGYCTDEAAAEIRRRIAETHARGIHFLDSGNYHYLTKFWIEKIREPFELIVFDRHSDMQPSALLPLTSCGNWLLEALEEQPLLRRVWLIGPAEETIENVPAKYRGTEPHHGAVLPAGHAGILRRNAIAVFRHVAVGGEKVCSAAAAPAGCMAVLQSVHQVKDVEADGTVKEIPVYKYGFLFLFRVSGKDIGGSQIRCDGEWLDIRYRQIAHHTPEPFTVEAVVGGHSEEGLRPFL